MAKYKNIKLNETTPSDVSELADSGGILHTQNTDTGTTGNTFVINSDSTTGKITLDVTLNTGQNRNMTITNEAMTDDRTITLPDETGTVSLVGHTHSLYAQTVVLESDYIIDANDTWETVLQSTELTYSTDILITLHLTFRERNSTTGFFELRLLKNGDVISSGAFNYTADQSVTISLTGYVTVDNGDIIYLQIYNKAGNYVYSATVETSSPNATVMNIIGITTP